MPKKNESLDEINDAWIRIDFAVTQLKEKLPLDELKVTDLYANKQSNMGDLLLDDVRNISYAIFAREHALISLAQVNRIAARVAQLKKNLGSGPQSNTNRNHIKMIERDAKVIKDLQKEKTTCFNMLFDDMKSYENVLASSGMKDYLGSNNPVLTQSFKVRTTCRRVYLAGKDIDIVADRVVKSYNVIHKPSETVDKKDTSSTESTSIDTEDISEKS